MKRIAHNLLIVTLTSAAAVATAADMPFPSAGGTYTQYDVFPNMETYASRHSDSDEALTAARQRAAERDNFIATASYARDATRTDIPTQDVKPRGQLEVPSQFPSREGPMDD